MDEPHAEPRPAVSRRTIALSVVLTAAALALGLLAWRSVAGAGPSPVLETRLDEPAGFAGFVQRLTGEKSEGWRELPFRLDAAEQADVDACRALAVAVRSRDQDGCPFDKPAIREQLEALLARRPDYFYAESLLALWHARNGDAIAARDWSSRAETHAPVVLVQTFRRPDGTPAAGLKIPEMAIECNRVIGGSIDQSLDLPFFGLTTDVDGRVRLPVYETVYRLASISYPSGHTLDMPRLGFFESRGRISLLPDATVRP